MITPLPHQQTGMEMARTRPKFGFGWKPGLGKTHLALGVCVERPLKTVALAPKSILHSAWMQDAAHYPKLRPLVIHGSTPARRSAMIAEGGWDLAITTYETFRRHHSEYIAAGVKRLIVDECFVAGTMVDTPSGAVPIERIKVGDQVVCASGVGTVSETSSKNVPSLVHVRTTAGDFVCSPNHVFLTHAGWTVSSGLKKGMVLCESTTAQQVMRNVRTGRSWQEESVLLQSLCEHMEDAATRDSGEDFYARSQEEDGCVKSEILGQRGGCWGNRTDEDLEPHVKSEGAGSCFKDAQVDGACASRPWGEWEGNACSATTALGGSSQDRPHVGARSGGQPWRQDSGIPDELQGGHRAPREEAGGGSGWVFPQGCEKEETGREEDRHADGPRVESVEVYERGSDGFARYSDGQDFVVCYDIGVSEHPTFSINGCIVHNCQKARNPEAQITKTLIPFADKMDEVYLLSGTMAPNNVTEYWSQLRMLAGPKARGYYQFCYHYAFPIKKRRWGKDKDGTRKQIEYISSWGQSPEQEVELRRVLEKWVWFLRKEDVRVFPPQQFHVREFDLSEKEEKAYNAISEELAIVSEGHVDPVKEGAVLIKLRQATGGEVMAGEKLVTFGDSKLEVLADLLDEIGPDEPVVIWAEFTAQVDRIVAMVKERGESVATIDGRSSGKAGETAAAFQAGEVQRLVCHPAAAGHGITLTRAAYCIYYSMSFSSEQYEQSQNRIHRVGQERPCTYYHLLATVTPDADDKAHGRERGETVDHRCYGVSSRKITASSAREMEVEKARKRRNGK